MLQSKVQLAPPTVNVNVNVENAIMKESIDILKGIDPAPFRPYLFLHPYTQEYVSSLISSDKIRTKNFHSKKYFSNGLCVINNIGELGEFS